LVLLLLKVSNRILLRVLAHAPRTIKFRRSAHWVRGFTVGSARIAASLGRPDVQREFVVDVQDVFEEAGIEADLRIYVESVVARLDSNALGAFRRAMERDGGLLAREIL
jgi:hypothetical protein